MTTKTPTFASKAEALTFRAQCENLAKLLTRNTKRQLEAIAIDKRAAVGRVRIYGQSSKQELINEILQFDYPTDRLNEAIHIIYHAPGENWSACEWCNQ